MNTPKCSIIVPVFKAENFLHRCIASVMLQTYQNWELLLIDDGSPDRSGAICDEYAIQDERIRVFHQKNSGVSIARNTGLNAMKGEYVFFLDSDDWFDINCLEYCINEMVRTKADIIQFPTEKTGKQSNDTSIRKIECGETLDVKEYISTNDFFVCIGGSVIRADIIQSNNIRFRSDIKLAEDQLFIMECMRFSQLIYRSDYPFYKYYINEASATHNSKSSKMADSIIALVDYKKKYPQYKNKIDQTLLYFIWYIVSNNDLSKKQVCKLIKDANLVKNKNFSWVENIFVLLAKMSPVLSVIFIRVYKAIKS